MPKGEYLQYGGQAIIEGVMMRSPRYFSVAVRAPNGEIVLLTEPLEKTWIGRQKWLKLPFLRGSLALLDAMSLGSRAFKYSSQVQLDPSLQPDSEANPPLEDSGSQTVEGSKLVQPEIAGGGSLMNIAVGATMVVAFAFALVLFKFMPLFLSEQFKRVGVHNQTALNAWQGVIGIIFFIGYLYWISKIPNINRVFKYHGAEHKAINTLEAEKPLTLDNCKAQTRLHPRCGTSFAIIVLIIDVLFGVILLPRNLVPEWSVYANLGVRFVVNLALLPIFAGIAYELIRFAGKFRTSSMVTALFAPGLATQLITTAEPDPDQIEVALTALRACVAAEENEGLTQIVDVPAASATSESIA